MSESDQARCQAFSEIEADYNPDTIDSTLFDKYITKTDPLPPNAVAQCTND